MTRRAGRWLLTTICATILAGCGVVDQSGRAVVYNLEAEQAQEQALLLNIVRAYLRRPMQFTTVSTITGTANASAGAQYTLPTNVPFRPATQGATGIAAFPPLPTWIFSGSVSGGPAFTVPVLDTQEFYQGILKAIPGQIWDLYIQANYPRDLLFNVFIQKVVVHTGDESCHTNHCEFVFVNHPSENQSEDIQIESFQAFADYLLELGLTTEPSKPPTVKLVGATTNVNVRYVGNPSSNGTTAQVIGPPGGSATSEAPPAPRPFKICFAPPTKTEADLVDPDSLCGSSEPDDSKPKSAGDSKLESMNREFAPSGVASLQIADPHGFIQTLESRQLKSLIKLKPELKDRLDLLDSHEPVKKGKGKLKITIYMRSTEGMIYYLGELVRRQYREEYPLETFEKEDKPYQPHKARPCVGTSESEFNFCACIFRLHQGPAPEPGAVVSVFYDGRWFSLPASQPHQLDRSSMTFEFLKQQIALNSSAKSLPQSSVITTAGP